MRCQQAVSLQLVPTIRAPFQLQKYVPRRFVVRSHVMIRPHRAIEAMCDRMDTRWNMGHMGDNASRTPHRRQPCLTSGSSPEKKKTR